MMLSLPVLFVIVLLSGATVSSISGLREYCNSETFSAACADDEVIVIRSALYGRMRTGRCLSHDSGVNPCWQNVIRQADRLCSGRRTCDVRVPEPSFDVTQPCPRNMRVYLEIIYECVQVVTVPHPDCDFKKQAVVQQPYGYLSSRITDEYGYGTMSCPYRIELPRGQRINVTLIDFTTPTGPRVDPPSHGQGGASGVGSYVSPAVYDPVYIQQSARTCYQYAMITEKSSITRNVRICGGERRERNIYTSRSNAVEIRITTRNTEHSVAEYHFLFQFGAIGCSDPDPPRYGWLIRDNDGVTMGCNFSDHEWRMSCDGVKWVGDFENCASGRPQKVFFNIGSLSIPYTISIGIIVGLAAIVVILLLLITMICIEWAKSRRQQRPRRRRTLSRSTEPQPTATAPPTDAVVPDSIQRPAVRAEANHYRREPSVKQLSIADQQQPSPSSVNVTSTLTKLSNSTAQPHQQQQQQQQQTAPPPQRSQQRNTVHFNTQVTVVQPEAAPLTPPPTSAGDLCLPPPPPPPPTHQPLNDQCGGPRSLTASIGAVTISSVPLQQPAAHEDIYVARCNSRDMWPAAPPPLSSAGPSVILMPASHAAGGSMFVPPPPEFDSNGMPTTVVGSVTSTAGNSPATTFNSSLDGYGSPPGSSTSTGGATLPRRNSMLAAMTTDLIDDVSMGTGGGPLNQPDDFTHIYETPKYLRREKAATLRHPGSGSARSRSQYGTMVAPSSDVRQQPQQSQTWNRQQLLQQQQQQRVDTMNHGGGPVYISRTMPRRESAMNGGNVGRPS